MLRVTFERLKNNQDKPRPLSLFRLEYPKTYFWIACISMLFSSKMSEYESLKYPCNPCEYKAKELNGVKRH